MNYSIYLTVLLTLITTGCSSLPGVKAQIAGANIEIAKTRAAAAAKPILDATIPTPSGVMHIVVHAPQGPNNGQIGMPEDAWARVADKSLDVLRTAGGIYLGGTAALGLVEAAGAGIVGALKSQPAPTVVNQPAPVIVSPADPIVVTQPAPVIVDPVVVNPVIVQPQP